MKRLKGIIYDCIRWLATIGARKTLPGNKLLIIRVDEIGDYILWHKFLKEIATSERFKDHEIHFCGNQSWRSLFNEFDTKWVSRVFWLDKTRFKKEIGYRYTFLKQICKQEYDVVINPTFSRDKRYDDSIVKAAKAADNYGMVANQESVQPYEKGYDKDLYNHLFDHAERPIFEFFRNRMFTEFVTGKKSVIADTKIDTTLLTELPVELPEKYFVVFPGSRSNKRIWPTENFVLAGHYLFDTHGWTAVVCGTASDAAYIDAFCEQYKQPCINLMSKTSLTDMLAVFAKATCLLSVDTGSVHLAAAVGCPVFGIFNGSQYKRFAPYPQQVAAEFYAIYPDPVEEELKNDALVKQKYEFVIDAPYAGVRAEKVILALSKRYPSER